MLFLMPNQQCQSTEGQTVTSILTINQHCYLMSLLCNNSSKFIFCDNSCLHLRDIVCAIVVCHLFCDLLLGSLRSYMADTDNR